MARLGAAAVVVVGALLGHIGAGSGHAAEPDFDRQIAPLLATRCLGCHAGDEPQGKLDLSTASGMTAGGSGGAAVVPGQLDESLLWERVSQGDMPPKTPLSAAEQELLRTWIAAGAKWGERTAIDPLAYSSESRAGYDWWSLQPVKMVAVPAVRAAERVRTPVDAFVLARLEEAGLSLSPEADRRTLIRRLSFDLLGLPPDVREVEAFVADRAPDAYERLVERLLASPHYGERWARHWLDIVRYGESQGFERDKLRTNAWPYRDWVISAFNDDLPYDQFVHWQIAGDVLAPDDVRGVTATGFLVAGPYDEVGQLQQSAAMRAVVRQDEKEDVIGVTCQTFLGLTAHCARCHDHKFDPISQAEYYRLSAALEGVRHGERTIETPAQRTERMARLASLQARLEAGRALWKTREAEIRQQLLTRLSGNVAAAKVPQPISRWDFEQNADDSVGQLHGQLHGKAEVRDGALHLDGQTAYLTTPPLDRALRARSLEVLVQLASLDQRGGGVISVETLNGSVFDAVVFGERVPRRWMAGSNGFVRTQDLQGADEAAAVERPVHLLLVYHDDRTIALFRNGEAYGEPYAAREFIDYEKGQSHVVLGLRHLPAGGNRFLAGKILHAALFDRALTQADAAALARNPGAAITREQIREAMSPEWLKDREAWDLEEAMLVAALRPQPVPTVYAVAPGALEPTHVLKRGDVRRKGAEVAPGWPRVIGDAPEQANLTDAERRIALARQIGSARNPLTARVMVNRLWQYHFGTGIVDTPNDFGFSGGRPSHPELLDWLAGEFVRSGWSVKAMHRLLVNSAAYRQESRPRPEMLQRDADNRLLWRKSPVRLDAETLRDALLAASGELNRTLGGPPFQDFRTFNFNSQFYETYDPEGPEFQRRTVYRTWVRSGRNELLDAFDCPDPSTTTPRRAVTTTPLQALALLNNSLVLRLADRLAERSQADGGDDLDLTVQAMVSRLLQRSPTAEERDELREFAARHGFAALARVLVNGNEFLYVD